MLATIFIIGIGCLGVAVLLMVLSCMFREWRTEIIDTTHRKAQNEGYEAGTAFVRREAIHRGLAYYHPQTSAFTWNESKPPPETIFPQPMPTKKKGTK
jgi:hypothetical protein